MPKETLKALDRDVERLLFAGAQVARGDADLGARKDKLAPLGSKAPAIAKVTEQVEKLQKAGTKGAAGELLNLAALMAQVRGAQAAPAQPAAKGELAPLPATEPIESPLTSTELTPLMGALANAPDARHRPKVISDAIERDSVRDLRILPFCVSALSDSAIGYLVEAKLLPKLGSVVVPELLATLKFPGKELDAKKLRVLARIQGAQVKPLLVEATEKGGVEVRGSALTQLASLEPATAEPIALKMLASDRSMEVKRAAAEALAGSSSDEALDALIKAFSSSEDLRDAAGEALSKLAHPRATERALALLTAELLSLTNFKMPKELSKAKKAEAEKAQQQFHKEVRLLASILDLLASRKDKGTHQTVLDVFRKHKVKEVRNAAAQALLKGGYEGAFDELAPSVYDADWSTRSEFIDHILRHDPEKAFDRFSRFLDPALLKTQNHLSFAQNILDRIEGESDEDEPDDEAEAEAEAQGEGDGKAPNLSLLDKDPRWADACIALLVKEDVVNSALDVLSHMKSPKVLEAVIKLASGKLKGDHAWRMLRVLADYKDPRVSPLLLRFLDVLSGYWGRRAVYEAVKTYDDPAVLPALRGWMASKKRLEKRDKEDLEALFQHLERDRTLAAAV